MLIRRRNKLGKLGIQFLQTRYHDLYSARFDWLNAHILKKKKKEEENLNIFAILLCTILITRMNVQISFFFSILAYTSSFDDEY